MKTKNHLLLAATAITILLFLYSALFMLDQTYQAKVIIDDQQLEATNQLEQFSKNKQDYKNLKALGFSDIAISHFSQDEFDYYKKLNGKIIDEISYYQVLKGSSERMVTQEEYKDLLIGFKNSNFPQTTSLVRINLKLADLGKRKFLVLTEHHFDYTPSNVPPMQMTISVPDYFIEWQNTKQIWWKTSLFQTNDLKSGEEMVEHTYPVRDPNEFDFGIGATSEEDSTYLVNWKKPHLFEDIVGLHFYTATVYTVPEEYLAMVAFVNVQNPHLSEQFFFELGE